MRAPLRPCLAAALLLAVLPARAAEIVVAAETVADTKAVFGQVLSRDVVPARARISGEVVERLVEEGSDVTAGQRVALVVDDKLALRIEAVTAQKAAVSAELANAEDELARGEALLARGVTTRQRVDALRTQLDVLRGRLSALDAERAVLEQEAVEGVVLAPAAGRVIDAPVTVGAVVLAGEPIALIAGGGFFLRLQLPERHAALVSEGMAVSIEGRPSAPGDGGATTGRVAKVYPQLDGGRVVIDVEADGLDRYLVGERTLVRVPVATRQAVFVPAAAVSTRSGIDFVTLREDGGEREVAVLTGARDGDRAEIVSGLGAGDVVVTP